MSLSRFGIRVFWALGVAATGGWLGCSQGNLPATDGEAAVATKTKQALDPGWTPMSLGASLNPPLSPAAWYVAVDSDQYVNVTNGLVTRWKDQSHHGDALGLVDYPYWMPEFHATGWAGKPTLTFTGHQMLKVDPWTGAPAGVDTGFTVLAVMRATGVTPIAVSSFLFHDPRPEREARLWRISLST
jgi:hypothetical protein